MGFNQQRALLLLIAVGAVWMALVGFAREPDLEPGQTRVSVMSFNVRYDNPGDELVWRDRLPAIVEMITDQEPAIIGMQEPLAHQVDQLSEALDGYSWIGVGTADGKQVGNFTPVFFRNDLFELGEHGTFWLSETPEVPSIGWDAALHRVVTWAELHPTGGGSPLTVFNTHFDHVGGTARARSAELLAERIATLVPHGPVVVTGDLNTVDLHPSLSPLLDILSDARSSAPVTDLTGSFNHWRTTLGLINIDFVLFRGAEAARFETINDDYGVDYLSDHFPIVATLHLPS